MNKIATRAKSRIVEVIGVDPDVEGGMEVLEGEDEAAVPEAGEPEPEPPPMPLEPEAAKTMLLDV